MATVEENVKEILGVNLKQINEGTCEMSQREMIIILVERLWKLEARVAKLEGRL